MAYDDEAKQMMVRLADKLPAGLGDTLADQAAALGPEALTLLLRFPEPLVYAGIRRWVRKVARRMDPAGARPVLLAAMSRPDWRIFEIARDVLCDTALSARDELTALLAGGEHAGGRLQALYCLDRLADPLTGAGEAGIVPHMARAAKTDPDEAVRAAAVVALTRCDPEGAGEALLAALADPAEAVRLQAAKAAGRLRLAPAGPMILPLLDHDDPDVRADAVYALDRIGDAAAAGPVADRLGDDDWYVRWSAAAALRRLWQDANVAALRRATEDSHPLVAAAAAETLAAKAPGA